MLLAWLGTITLCAIQLVMMQHGAGVNVWDVPKEELREFLKASRSKYHPVGFLSTDPMPTSSYG
jgi:hypothetical protein